MNIKNDYAKNSKTHFCFYQNAIRVIWTFGFALCIFISILSSLNSNNDSLSLACFILGFGYLILYIGTMLFWRSKAAYGREFEIMKPQTADYIAASYLLLIFIAAVYFNINFMQYEIRRYIFLGSTVLFAIVSIFLCLRRKDLPSAVKALRNILIGIAVQIQIVILNAPAVLNKINAHYGILTEEQIKILEANGIRVMRDSVFKSFTDPITGETITEQASDALGFSYSVGSILPLILLICVAAITLHFLYKRKLKKAENV